ncbi:MAG TPA: DUF4340 domain-containing protein [Gemmatimonadales bacterium]|nr:DUF4340 domain-containing protein [Gemmatimonadales bacterium]
MSARQLLRMGIALVVLLALWGAAAFARRHRGSPAGEDAFRLPAVARASVDTVVLTHGADTAVLARQDSARWTVNGHRAAPRAVADLFAALADTAPASELIAEEPASHAALGVDSAGGTHVEMRGGGKMLVDFIAGNRSAQSGGGYVRRVGEDPTYLLHGRLVDAVTRQTDSWRDHKIAAVPSDSVARIDVTRSGHHYTLARGEEGWRLKPGGAVDTAQVADLLSEYRAVDATAFASPAQADSLDFRRPDRRTRLERKDGSPILTLLIDSTKAGFWAKADTGQTVYRIDSYTADRLAPEAKTLEAQPAAKAAKASAKVAAKATK